MDTASPHTDHQNAGRDPLTVICPDSFLQRERFGRTCGNIEPCHLGWIAKTRCTIRHVFAKTASHRNVALVADLDAILTKRANADIREVTYSRISGDNGACPDPRPVSNRDVMSDVGKVTDHNTVVPELTKVTQT